MDQSCAVNGRVSSPTSPKVPPPLPPNPPRNLPGRRTSSTSLTLVTSPTPDKLPRPESGPVFPTADSTPRSPPPGPIPADLPREQRSSSGTSTSPGASGQMVFSVSLKSTPVRQPSGSLLGIGRRDAMLYVSTEIKAKDATVYRRNPSGVYFQMEQPWTSFDGSEGLEVGDEVLAVDNYKMVDMSLDTAR